MNVVVKAWNHREVLAVVDGIRVRIDRNTRRVRWRCDACGHSTNGPGCAHARALAVAPAVPIHKPHHRPSLTD